MKKLCLLLLICCLFGCGSKETTTVCKLENDVVTITNTLVSVKDKLIKQTNVNQLEFTKYGYTAEQMKYAAENYKSVYDKIGVEYTYSIDGNYLKETVVVDYENTDFNQLASAGLIESVDENVKVVSLEKTLDSYKKQGFTCE